MAEASIKYKLVEVAIVVVVVVLQQVGRSKKITKQKNKINFVTTHQLKPSCHISSAHVFTALQCVF